MTIHELKTWPEYYKAVVMGVKTFEVRKDDRNFAVDDILVLREFDPDKKKYTGHMFAVGVTYCLRKPPFVPEGYVIMGIKELNN